MVVQLVQGRRLIGASATVSGQAKINIGCVVGSVGRLDTRSQEWIKDKTSEDGCSSGRSDLEVDQEASSLEPGHEVVCGTKEKEIEGSWSRRRHMTEAKSSTEAGRRVVQQGENDDVLVQRMHISWGRKHGVVHISWGRKAHLVWKFPDVCPEVVADVVAEADVMLSGETHVESRYRARVM
ncbi:hypothetical protein DY000_02009487 [Brassica cretica]|uniref:DUF4283 domain-containing protein n=1 Tax=Brassica cretica TaxID=69181 RepID=A0ABQ7BYK0_BRACR|nr:hypothetical protein DY000_02009487 [Brassica cretica]